MQYLGKDISEMFAVVFEQEKSNKADSKEFKEIHELFKRSTENWG